MLEHHRALLVGAGILLVMGPLTACQPREEPEDYVGPVTVTERKHIPSWPQTVIVGNSTTVVVHPDTYRLRVCTPAEKCWTSEVNRAVYVVAHEGTTINAEHGELSLPEGARP